MPKSKAVSKKIVPNDEKKVSETEVTKAVFLTSKQELADFYCVSISTLNRWLSFFPFENATGLSGLVNGRWRVLESDALKYFRMLQKIMSRRHPDAKRINPIEPPDLSEISARQ